MPKDRSEIAARRAGQEEETESSEPATIRAYDGAFTACRAIFHAKTADYGTSWRILRPIAVTDQLWIKARRIRTLEEGVVRRVEENRADDLRALVNYAVVGLIQLEHGASGDFAWSAEQALAAYDAHRDTIRELMRAKNNDYGEAWRDMRPEGLTDLILAKLLRIRRIEARAGRTSISEGIASHYTDLANYALFALIRLGEGEDSPDDSDD